MPPYSDERLCTPIKTSRRRPHHSWQTIQKLLQWARGQMGIGPGEILQPPCGMLWRRTEQFYQRKMQEQLSKVAPPVTIQSEQVLPPQSSPTSPRHPVYYNSNSCHHGIAVIAVVVALIVRKLTQQRQAPKINTLTTDRQMKSSTMSARRQTSKGAHSRPLRKMFLFFAFTLCTHLCTRGVNTGHQYKPFLLQHVCMQQTVLGEAY